MQFLNRLLGQIKAQLGNLNTSQRLVILLLIIVMIGAVWWGIDYSAQRETVPLLNQSFAEDEMIRVTAALDRWMVDYDVRGDRIYVPRSQQRTLIYKLGAEQALPKDSHSTWTALIENTNLMVPESVRADKRLVVRQIVLADAIATWPNVASVQVILNPGDQRTLSRYTPAASASVTVQMDSSGTGTRKLAAAIADFIAGANNRVKRESVTVVIDGKQFPVNPQGQELSSAYLEVKAHYEQYFREKITAVLPVSNALVQVDVIPLTTRTETRTTTILPEGNGSWLAPTEKTTREETSNAAANAAEPGITANLADNQTPAATATTDSAEEGTTLTKPIPGSKDIHESTPAGGIKKITASVLIPYEYFVNLAKIEDGNTDEPAPETVESIVAREIPGLQTSIMHTIGLEPDQTDSVVVDTYWAAGFAAGTAGSSSADTAPQTADVGSITALARNHAKQIAVTALAVISLFMVLMMVRKAAGPVNISEEEAAALINGQRPPEALSPEDTEFQDQDAAAGLLAGIEVGDDTVHSQQVLGQIRELIDESPDTAANLLKKWITEDH